jgi:predicted peptidase
VLVLPNLAGSSTVEHGSTSIAEASSAIVNAAGNTVLLQRSMSARHTLEPFGEGSLLKIGDPSTYAALVHVPPKGVGRTGDADRFPLLLFLHGAGESGKEWFKLKKLVHPGATTPMPALSNGTAIPALANRFIVIAPQTPYREYFPTKKVLTFLSFVLDPDVLGRRIDKQKLYITGHSNGGFAALRVAASKRFAAVAPIAPSGRVSAHELRNVPVWAFHGKNDIVASYKISEQLIAGLRKLGVSNADANITLYDDAPPPPGALSQTGHGSTIPAYNTIELFDWFLQRQLKA